MDFTLVSMGISVAPPIDDESKTGRVLVAPAAASLRPAAKGRRVGCLSIFTKQVSEGTRPRNAALSRRGHWSSTYRVPRGPSRAKKLVPPRFRLVVGVNVLTDQGHDVAAGDCPRGPATDRAGDPAFPCHSNLAKSYSRSEEQRSCDKLVVRLDGALSKPVESLTPEKDW